LVKRRLDVTEEQKLFVEQMREALAGIQLDGPGRIFDTEGCGANCKVTCAHYCRANCDEECDATCLYTFKGEPIEPEICFWFKYSIAFPFT